MSNNPFQITVQNQYFTLPQHVTDQNANCQEANDAALLKLLDQNKSSCLPCAARSLVGLSMLALFIINCCVLSGAAHLSSQTLGALNLSATGLGLVSSLVTFATTKKKMALIGAIISATLVAVFALGLPNPSILSARTLAWIYIAPAIAVTGFAILGGICGCAGACCCPKTTERIMKEAEGFVKENSIYA